jgi:hypothetical protein
MHGGRHAWEIVGCNRRYEGIKEQLVWNPRLITSRGWKMISSLRKRFWQERSVMLGMPCALREAMR